jgi:hypothetical protein
MMVPPSHVPLWIIPGWSSLTPLDAEVPLLNVRLSIMPTDRYKRHTAERADRTVNTLRSIVEE